MEFREVWPLIERFVARYLNTCCFDGCQAKIKDIYHMWQNHTHVHVRLCCENNHYDWHQIALQGLYSLLTENEGMEVEAHV